LTSSESLAVTPAMPTFSFSLLTISPFTSNRPIQNVPGIFGWRVSNEIYNLMRIPIDQEVNTSRKGEVSIRVWWNTSTPCNSHPLSSCYPIFHYIRSVRMNGGIRSGYKGKQLKFRPHFLRGQSASDVSSPAIIILNMGVFSQIGRAS